MFSKLRNEISAHKVRYSVISAVLVLAVYDDEVTVSLPKVLEWVKKIASSPAGAM